MHVAHVHVRRDGVGYRVRTRQHVVADVRHLRVAAQLGRGGRVGRVAQDTIAHVGAGRRGSGSDLTEDLGEVDAGERAARPVAVREVADPVGAVADPPCAGEVLDLHEHAGADGRVDVVAGLNAGAVGNEAAAVVAARRPTDPVEHEQVRVGVAVDNLVDVPADLDHIAAARRTDRDLGERVVVVGGVEVRLLDRDVVHRAGDRRAGRTVRHVVEEVRTRHERHGARGRAGLLRHALDWRLVATQIRRLGELRVSLGLRLSLRGLLGCRRKPLGRRTALVGRDCTSDDRNGRLRRSRSWYDADPEAGEQNSREYRGEPSFHSEPYFL